METNSIESMRLELLNKQLENHFVEGKMGEDEQIVQVRDLINIKIGIL